MVSSQFLHLINHDCLPNTIIDAHTSLIKSAEAGDPIIVLRAIRDSTGVESKCRWVDYSRLLGI